MTVYHALVGVAILLGGSAALYALHRLALWLEARGHLFYLNKKPDSSPASAFVALQQLLEPEAKHVHHVQEQKQHRSEDEGGGAAP